MKSLPHPKIELRQQLRHKRREFVAQLSSKQRQAAAQNLCCHVQEFLKEQPASIIAGFWPLLDEINTRPLLEALAEKHQIGLPVIIPQTPVMEFHRWEPASALKTGAFNIPVPHAAETLPQPDIVLTPGIAFDLQGHRLGFGRGHYDRCLAAIRQKKSIIVVGLAFDIQIVDQLPFQVFDEPVDCLITDQRIIQIVTQ